MNVYYSPKQYDLRVLFQEKEKMHFTLFHLPVWLGYCLSRLSWFLVLGGESYSIYNCRHFGVWNWP